MLRIRVRCGQGKRVLYTNADVIKDAAFAMLQAAGCPAERLVGEGAGHWGAGAVCPRKIAPGTPVRRATEILVSTSDPAIAACLAKADPAAMRKYQPATGETIDMSGATIVGDAAPVMPDSSFIDAITLSPIVVSRRDGREKSGRFHHDVADCDLNTAINHRLSRIAGRPVALTLVPDDLYLSGRPKGHAVRADIKSMQGKAGVVVGLVFPFVLCGSPEDLRLAWYAGLGEKNRLGFGFFGLAA